MNGMIEKYLLRVKILNFIILVLVRTKIDSFLY